MTERHSLSGSLPEGRLVVAVSGGVDSMVLLHQLRFIARRGEDLVVAHLDHGMRGESARDALWLRGVCTAWAIPFHTARAESAPGSEEEARLLRYEFLEDVRVKVGAGVILTAHHADDQVETVLFRILRGTGLRGLAGIPPRRGHLVRPFLGTHRGEIAEYASRWAVPFREDPTNHDSRYARNALRHRVLPLAVESVAAGSRSALLRLARNASRAQEELEALESVVLSTLLEEVGPDRVEVSERALRTLPEPVLRRVARAGARRLGVVLSESVTERAVRAFRELAPGRGLDLGRGVRLERGSGTWLFVRLAGVGERSGLDARIEIGGEGTGSATLSLAGRQYRVTWGPRSPEGAEGVAVPIRIPRPLTVRGWERGDRIRLSYGSKPVAKLLGEAGIAALDRPAVPLAVDAKERVLWVPGVALSVDVRAVATGGDVGGGLFLGCEMKSHE